MNITQFVLCCLKTIYLVQTLMGLLKLNGFFSLVFFLSEDGVESMLRAKHLLLGPLIEQ